MTLPADPDSSSPWEAICAALRRRVGDSEFELWLSPLEFRGLDGDVLTLGAPPATQAWVAKRFGAALAASAKEIVGADVDVRFGERGHATPGRRGAGGDEPVAAISTLNPRYSFGQFIIGDGNRLAHAAALAVAELPGQALNPLFLYAPPGLGKTHLLHAIGNYVLGFGDGATVRYATVESFTNQFISALSTKKIGAFKHAYRDADVLLIDDVQFLANKTRTEEEFFHTFNALYDNGRQLVLTCDRLPVELDGIAGRLRERFEAGLVAEITAPDLATRVAILRKRASLDDLRAVDDDVLELIAEQVTDNVRALEGALIRVVAHHSLTGRPIDLSLACKVLGDRPAGTLAEGITVDRIQRTVVARYDMTVDELTSSSRRARVAWPRHLAMHLARELTGTPLHRIGAAFGGRNHTTVLHASKRVEQRVAETPEAARELQELTTALTTSR